MHDWAYLYFHNQQDKRALSLGWSLKTGSTIVLLNLQQILIGQGKDVPISQSLSKKQNVDHGSVQILLYYTHYT